MAELFPHSQRRPNGPEVQGHKVPKWKALGTSLGCRGHIANLAPEPEVRSVSSGEGLCWCPAPISDNLLQQPLPGLPQQTQVCTGLGSFQPDSLIPLPHSARKCMMRRGRTIQSWPGHSPQLRTPHSLNQTPHLVSQQSRLASVRAPPPCAHLEIQDPRLCTPHLDQGRFLGTRVPRRGVGSSGGVGGRRM